MIFDYTDEFVRNNLPAFFLEKGGPALFEQQKTGIIPNLYNLSRYYTKYVIPAAQKNLVFACVQDQKIVGYIFAETELNQAFQLKQPIATGVFTFVLPEYRRNGIARQLRQRMLGELKSQNYTCVICSISENNIDGEVSMREFIQAFPHEKFNTYKVDI